MSNAMTSIKDATQVIDDSIQIATETSDFKMLSRTDYIVEMIKGMRKEIARDKTHYSSLNSEVRKLQANI